MRSILLILLLFPATVYGTGNPGMDVMANVTIPAADSLHVPVPQVSCGQIRRILLPSRFVDMRPVDVWLPPGYDSSAARGTRFPVLYMNDGQMLFDTSVTWNGLEWRMDETMGQLIAVGRIAPCIVVGIHNNGVKRRAEFFPERVIEGLPDADRDSLLALMPGGPIADRYLRFITSELKPFVDSTFATLPDAAHTFVGGSSSGALGALYAICEYPEVFSAAACISTHWIGRLARNEAIPAAIRTYLAGHLPPPDRHRFYFDHGDRGLDSAYPEHQRAVDGLMRAHGYDAGNWTTRVHPGADHNERHWSARLSGPLLFLLSP